MTMVAMNLSCCLERVPVTMGRTKLILYAGLIGSWVGQVPFVVICTSYWRFDLYGLYTGVSLGYLLLDLILGTVIARTDY